MEFNEPEEPAQPAENNQDYDVEIYSRSAIWGFSIFFSTIFGGILLMLNLKAAGHKKAGNQVLLFSVAYLLLSSLLLDALGANPYIALVFNMIGAAILTQYFFNKYFPETDYYPKSIAIPLLVSLLICIPIGLFVYYYGPKAGIK